MRLIVFLAAFVAMGSAFPPAERRRENNDASLFEATHSGKYADQVTNEVPAVNHLSEIKIDMRDVIKERQTSGNLAAQKIKTPTTSAIQTSTKTTSTASPTSKISSAPNSTTKTASTPAFTPAPTPAPTPAITPTLAVGQTTTFGGTSQENTASGISISWPSESGFPTLIPGADGSNSTNGTGVSPDGTDTGTKIPVPIIAGVAGGVFVLLVIACLCCIGRKKRWCRKKRPKYAPLSQPGVHVNVSQNIPLQQHGPSHIARAGAPKNQFGGTGTPAKQIQPKVQHAPVYQSPAQQRHQPPSYHVSPPQSTRQQTPKNHTVPFPQTIYSTPPPAPVGPPPKGKFNSMGVWVPEKSTTPRPRNARNG